MPSPFPGMNPYLEQPGSWMDFHQAFAIYIRDTLVPLVGTNYYVGVEERLYVSEWNEEDRESFVGRADVSVHEPMNGPRDSSTLTATLEAPLQVLVEIPEANVGLNALSIRDRESEAIVTVIEILSPSNKFAGDDRAAYLEKRAEILSTNTNLVEIDILRGGPKLPARGMTKCDYHILVSSPKHRPHAGVWPFNLREPIPPFPVPLRDSDSPAILNLKPVLDRLYDAANYGRRIYRHPPVPPLTAEDAAWAEEILAESERKT